MKVYTIAGKTTKNYIQGNKGHHSRPHARHLMTSRTKGTDATNLRPLENAPFHPAYRSGVAVKGRSADDKVPGNLRVMDRIGIETKTILAVVFVTGVLYLALSKKSKGSGA